MTDARLRAADRHSLTVEGYCRACGCFPDRCRDEPSASHDHSGHPMDPEDFLDEDES